MKYFTSVYDVPDLNQFVKESLQVKANPYADSHLGKNKTIGLIFMNPSLRTRLSTQKAALNLGMSAMVMNVDKEGWALEFGEQVVMDGNTVEHVKDAAAVMGQYCDMLAIRCFPGLKNREEDYSEHVLEQFKKYCGVPLISLESATRHPLQSFADLITITEHKKKERPKVVLTWAPHIKPLPQAVSNSFSEWMCKSNVEFVITHPPGYELHSDFTKGAAIVYNQDEALKNADFIYVKNWSSYKDYGKILSTDERWLITGKKLKLTNEGKAMHCLPVRRGLELSYEVLDGPHSLVQQQAGNRLYAAQTVLKKILEAF